MANADSKKKTATRIPQLSGMSEEQLDAMLNAIHDAKLRRTIAKIEPLRGKYITLIDRIGEAVRPFGLTAAKFLALSPDQLRRHIQTRIDGQVGAPRSTRAEPKYRNPENPEQTWTGRGKHPHWVRDFLAGGGDLASIAIAPPEAKDAAGD